MNLLAIETSGETGSIALACAGHVDDRRIEDVREQSSRLLACVDELLAARGVSLDALAAIVFGQGPGSFTGLRLAAATAQGLAMARGLPLVPISSLAALAQQGWRRARAECVLTCVDARMGEVYWAEFRIAAGLAEPVTPERLTPPGAVAPSLRDALAVGTGFARYPAELGRWSMDPARCWPAACPSAVDLLPLAARALASGASQPPEAVAPVYLRGESAWRRHEPERSGHGS